MTNPKKKRIQIANPMLEITIVASIPLLEEDVETTIEEALETLRGLGSADIIERRVTGEPK